MCHISTLLCLSNLKRTTVCQPASSQHLDCNATWCKAHIYFIMTHVYWPLCWLARRAVRPSCQCHWCIIMSVCGILWHCVGGDPPSRIDYVWVSGKPVGARVTMQRAHKSCSYSDHLGVEAVCTFEEACTGRCVWVSQIDRTAGCLVLT